MIDVSSGMGGGRYACANGVERVCSVWTRKIELFTGKEAVTERVSDGEENWLLVWDRRLCQWRCADGPSATLWYAGQTGSTRTPPYPTSTPSPLSITQTPPGSEAPTQTVFSPRHSDKLDDVNAEHGEIEMWLWECWVVSRWNTEPCRC